MDDNSNNQSGNDSLNVGRGDFRHANIHVGDNNYEKPTFTPEQLGVERTIVFGGRLVHRESLNTFGIVSGLASIAGLYFTLFPASPSPLTSSLSTIFMFLFGFAGLSLTTSFFLKKQRFGHFFFRRLYLEAGSNEGVYLTKLFATCPWCSSKMKLINVGPKDGPRDDVFICERNPKQHRVLLDPTVLEAINENRS